MAGPTASHSATEGEALSTRSQRSWRRRGRPPPALRRQVDAAVLGSPAWPALGPRDSGVRRASRGNARSRAPSQVPGTRRPTPETAALPAPAGSGPVQARGVHLGPAPPSPGPAAEGEPPSTSAGRGDGAAAAAAPRRRKGPRRGRRVSGPRPRLRPGGGGGWGGGRG